MARGGPLMLVALAASACAGRSLPAPAATPAGVFPMPRFVEVSVAPYSSVDDALTRAEAMDWRDDAVRARAITLAYAARELQNHLGLVGVDAEVVSAAPAGEPALVLAVSETDYTTDAGEVIDHAWLGSQGYAITPSGRRVYLTAPTQVGVLYACYRLLEHLGFDWPDAWATSAPTLDAARAIEWPALREAPSVKRRGFMVFGNEIVPDEFVRWMARNRFNIGGRARTPLGAMLGITRWAGGHEVMQQVMSEPGLFNQHPDWFALIDGERRPIEPAGSFFNPAFANPELARWYADRMIERLEGGVFYDVDVLNIWPADDRFNAFDQSPDAQALGNETDNLLYFYAGVCRALREARAEGRLRRPVTVAGISYFLTMRAPTNREVVAELAGADYLHVFYPIERDWAGFVDADLDDRDKHRELLAQLQAWQDAAPLSYGVVEYYNVSSFGAVALSHARYLEHDYQVLSSSREGLFAYMHPLLNNPGPRSLTNSLLAHLAWQGLDGDRAFDGPTLIERWRDRRYGDQAQRWGEVQELMERSVENAQQMFGIDSLSWVLFEAQTWSVPYYSHVEGAGFVERFRAGGVQDLPGRYSGRELVRASFRGLDDSLALQAQAATLWRQILDDSTPAEVRSRMEADVAWYAATASRYRLLAATCDWFVSQGDEGARADARARMEDELALLEVSPLLHDTVSPLAHVDQSAFLEQYRDLLGSP